MLCADGTSWPAALVACAAKRWLARNAAGVTLIRSHCYHATATAILSLVSCLPALEHVQLSLPESLVSDDLGCLLEALAWCPRLRVLDLYLEDCGHGDDNLQLVPDPLAFAKLPNLTRLALYFVDYAVAPCILEGVADALVSVTRLAELTLRLNFHQRVVVPAALRELKALRSLALSRFNPCVLEAECFDLPNLESLVFQGCDVRDARVLPGIAALQRLTHTEFSGGSGPFFFDAQLVQLPLLQRMVLQTRVPCWNGHAGLLSRLPADMGSFSATLLHVDFTGHGFEVFPLVLTQLAALECLKAGANHFAELPLPLQPSQG